MMTKSLKFLFVCLFIFALSACDEDDEPTSSVDLVGTWEVQSFSFDIETVTSLSGIETTVTTSGSGSNLDYNLEFMESTFVTSGSYSYSVASDLNGVTTSQINESVSDVSGSGTYSTSGNEITLNGSFFEFTFDGIDLSALVGEQTANYEIKSDGTLVFTQDEEGTTTTQGLTVTSKVKSTSTWIKQSN